MTGTTPLIWVALDGFETDPNSNMDLIDAIRDVPGVSPDTIGFKWSVSAIMEMGSRGLREYHEALEITPFPLFFDLKTATEPREMIRQLRWVAQYFPDAYANVWANYLFRGCLRSAELRELVPEIKLLSLITSSFVGESDTEEQNMLGGIERSLQLGCVGCIVPAHSPAWVFDHIHMFRPEAPGYIVATGVRPDWYEDVERVHHYPVTPRRITELGVDSFPLGAPLFNPPRGMSQREWVGIALSRVLQELKETSSS